MTHRAAIFIALVLTAPIAVPSGAGARQQTRAQRRCVSALQHAGIGVTRAQARRSMACLHAAAAGDEPELRDCVGADADGGVTLATRKTADVAIRHCTTDPADVGVPRNLEISVNDAAVVHAQGLVADLFGDEPAAIRRRADDKAGAKCQRAALGAVHDAFGAMQTGFLGCTNRALRRGADDPSDLAACADGSTGAKRRTARLAKTIDRRCASPDLLPGVCGDATPEELGACVAARARCRACRSTATAAGLDVDCDLIDDGAANDSCTFLVSVRGNALNFIGGTAAPIADAEVSILELPERQTTTGLLGEFRFDDLPEGSEVTLVMNHPEYYPIQTGTTQLGPRGAERVTFQAVTFGIFNAFATILGLDPDPSRCQMVTTVTRAGKSIYDPGAHGEDRVTVRLDPPLPADQGPVYFNASVIPDRSLVETSEDGGVLFVQVPPGDYEWTAFKPAHAFTRVKMKCRAGFLVNASPPWGLQTH